MQFGWVGLRDRIWHTVLDDFKVARLQRHDIKDADGSSE